MWLGALPLTRHPWSIASTVNFKERLQIIATRQGLLLLQHRQVACSLQALHKASVHPSNPHKQVVIYPMHTIQPGGRCNPALNPAAGRAYLACSGSCCCRTWHSCHLPGEHTPPSPCMYCHMWGLPVACAGEASILTVTHMTGWHLNITLCSETFGKSLEEK